MFRQQAKPRAGVASDFADEQSRLVTTKMIDNWTKPNFTYIQNKAVHFSWPFDLSPKGVVVIILSDKKDATLALIKLLQQGLREHSPHEGEVVAIPKSNTNSEFCELHIIRTDKEGFHVLNHFPPFDMHEFQSPFTGGDELKLFEKYVREGERIWALQRSQAA